MFRVEEEAFILLTIRKHLLGLYGRQRMYAVVAPSCHSLAVLNSNSHAGASLAPLLAGAPALPESFNEDDVGSSSRLVERDVGYYHKLCEMLDMQDSLKEDLVFTRKYDVFTFPNDGSSTTTRSSSITTNSEVASSSLDEESSDATSRRQSSNCCEMPFRKQCAGRKHRFNLRQRVSAKTRDQNIMVVNEGQGGAGQG
jgi:hypothetical protein